MNKRLGFLLLLSFMIFGSIFLIGFLNYHYQVITYPYQIEYREGAHYYIGSELSKGNFPFTLKSQPDLSYMYGIGFPLISSVFIKFFGNDLFSLRLISALAIFSVSIYFFQYNLKLKVKISQIVLSAILFYGINLFLCIPSARPDALGYLFFILSIFIPYQSSFTKKSLLTSIIFALFAFYTKPYFLVSFLIIAFYLFLFQSIKRGLKYLFIYLFSLFISLILIEQVFDFYFLGTLGIQLSESVFVFEHMVLQTSFFFKDLVLYLSIVFFTYLFVKLFRKRKLLFATIDTKPFWFDNYINLSDFDKPFMLNKLNFNLFVFIVSFLFLTFKLGGHTGQFGVYYIQFLLFPFLSYINYIFKNHDLKKVEVLQFLIIITLYQFTNMLPENKIYNYKKAQRFFKQITKHDNVLASPAVASFLIKKDKKVYLSGLTEYSGAVTNLKKNTGLPSVLAKMKDKLFLNKISLAEMKANNYKERIIQKIEDKQFDYIVTDTSIYDDWLINKNKLINNYVKSDSFELNMSPSYTQCLFYVYIPNTLKTK